MNRRIRLRKIDAEIFPGYVRPELVFEYFEFVESGYDFCFLPLIDERASRAGRSVAYWDQYIDHRSRLAVVNTLYDYGESWPFAQQMRSICDRCEIVFGPQLPVDADHPGLTPVFYPALVDAILQPGQTPFVENWDLSFWGEFKQGQSNAQEVIPLCSRRYRARVIGLLEEVSQRRKLRTSFRPISFWELGQDEQAQARLNYRQTLLQTRVCLSLYGYGYNCYRNAEIFALRRPLFSPKLHHHVLVPEAHLWRDAELGFFFEDDCSDLESALLQALGNPAEQTRRAHNGWLYYQRNCTRRAIAETIYNRLSVALDDDSD